jgi:ATP-dependent DNA helicase RecG
MSVGKEMRLDTSVQKLKGVGPKAAEALAKKEIFTVGDLLRFYPAEYDFFTEPETAAEAQAGTFCTLRLTVVGSGSTLRRGARVISHFEGSDGTAKVRLTFFNMPYVRQTLTAGAAFVFRGILRQTGNGSRYMEQPRFYPLPQYERLMGTLQPRYRQIRGIGESRMRTLLKTALEETQGLNDDLPQNMQEKYDLIGQREAVRTIHFPPDRASLQSARRRLIFDEFFSFIIGIRRQKSEEGERRNPRPMKASMNSGWCGRLLQSLPFSLTQEQARAWQEIKGDLTGPVLMNRLVQGDVGSGKTILAFLALVLCAENGRQGALMAPTEVLARQHMEGFTRYMQNAGLPVRAVLLTGALKRQERKEALQAIADGSAHVVIGTHALFQDAVEFHDLGLVITDEQHRFGVRQRAGLADKGEDVPVLVMSATPIPRTLAIILYGELQVSSLRELPPGRQPIKSLAMQDTRRGSAYRFILSEIKKGRQCYVICPAVEEGEMQEIENVSDYTEKLSAALPSSLRIASMTGRMRPEEKTAVMDAFSAGSTDILVSTTVIEVGINVPNATVILIENAERFGLSQLHQLRGRVGRGQEQSYCIFLYRGREKPERLAILEENSNGFSIAEQDLRTRGPGDLFGVRQSGLPQFTLADLYEDADVLKEAAACAEEILRENPGYRCAEERVVDYSTI